MFHYSQARTGLKVHELIGRWPNHFPPGTLDALKLRL
jgi:hypothetical protein